MATSQQRLPVRAPHCTSLQAPARRPGLRRHTVTTRCAMSSYNGATVCSASNGSIRRWRMASWLENKASVDVPLPLEPCWVLWDDRERIPQWMPWIKSVKVQEADPRLSRWTLATHQFGRDWEFSWLARNLAPIKGQKIHWQTEPGTSSYGLEIKNTGQIRFIRKGPQVTNITLTISYEVPSALAPFANLLTPVVEGIIGNDMQRFRDYALAYYAQQQHAAQAPVVATSAPVSQDK